MNESKKDGNTEYYGEISGEINPGYGIPGYDRERMTEELLELLKIDSISLDERKVADLLLKKLTDLGFSPCEDDAGTKIGGNTGNIICKIPACIASDETVIKSTGKNNKMYSLLFMAHMDTVTPGIGKKPTITDGVIHSDGTTILGSDDLAGVECMLEALRIIKAANIPHGAITVVFSVAEEIGLLGVKNLDYSNISTDFGIVLDGGCDIGEISVNAPSQNAIEITVHGRAAHAGVEPENGVNAIKVAANAISNMKLGRIDEETTANIGVINGGRATNIICDRVELKGEARSRNETKLDAQTQHMKACFDEAAKAAGASIDFHSNLMFPSFNISPDSSIASLLRSSADRMALTLKMIPTGGGSDTNILNGKGIPAVNIGVGMNKVHTLEECIALDDLALAVRFVFEIIKTAGGITND